VDRRRMTPFFGVGYLGLASRPSQRLAAGIAALATLALAGGPTAAQSAAVQPPVATATEPARDQAADSPIAMPPRWHRGS